MINAKAFWEAADAKMAAAGFTSMFFDPTRNPRVDAERKIYEKNGIRVGISLSGLEQVQNTWFNKLVKVKVEGALETARRRAREAK